MSEPNLRLQQASRHHLRSGDLFVMCLADDLFVFGRVIRTDVLAGWSMPNAILLYIYDWPATSPEPPPRRELSPDRLLVPPLMTNRLGWSRGYFRTIANWPLEPGEAFDRHCFESSRDDRACFDEFANELPHRSEPCGEWGLHSYRTIDDAVSGALGLPLAPD